MKLKKGFLNQTKTTMKKKKNDTNYDDTTSNTTRLNEQQKRKQQQKSDNKAKSKLNWSKGFLCTNDNSDRNNSNDLNKKKRVLTNNASLLAFENGIGVGQNIMKDKKDVNGNRDGHRDGHGKDDMQLMSQPITTRSTPLNKLLIVEENENNADVKSKSPMIQEINGIAAIDDDNDDDKKEKESNNIELLSSSLTTTKTKPSSSTSKPSSPICSSRIILPFDTNDKEEEDQNHFFIQEKSSKRISKREHHYHNNHHQQQQQQQQQQHTHDTQKDDNVKNSTPYIAISDETSEKIKSASNDNTDSIVTATATATTTSSTSSAAANKMIPIIKTSKTLPTELSLVLSQLKIHKKIIRNYLKNRKKMNATYTIQNEQQRLHQSQQQQEQQQQLYHKQKMYVTPFIDKFVNGDKNNNNVNNYINQHNNNISSNMHFIWDSILEQVASYGKDKSLYSFTTIIAVVSKDNDSLSSAYYWSQYMSFLPPTIHLAFEILASSSSSQHNWNSLFDYMQQLLHDFSQNDDEMVITSFSPVQLKRSKLQFLGISILMKLYICFYLHLLQLYVQDKVILNGENSSTTQLHITDIDCSGSSSSSSHSCSNNSSVIDLLWQTSISIIPILLKRGIPLMSQMIQKTGKKRTLLNTYGMNNIILALEYAALSCKVNIIINKLQVEKISMMVWDELPTVKTLLQLKLAWSTATKSKNEEEKAILVGSSDASGDDYSAAMKKECCNIIIEDLLKTIKVLHEYDVEAQTSQNKEMLSVQLLFIDDIAGSFISDKNNKDSLSLRVGGVGQSLIVDNHDSNHLEYSHLLHYLEAAAQIMSASKISNNERSNGFLDRMITPGIHCLRGACTWISFKKKALERLVEMSLLQKVVDYCQIMFRYKSERCSQFTLKILNYLWSQTQGLPADISILEPKSTNVQSVPQSFVALLEQLHCMETSPAVQLDPVERQFCDLIEHCIIHCPSLLLSYFTKNTKNSVYKFEILASLLGKSKKCCVLSSNQRRVIEDELLSILPSNKHVQRLLSSNPCLISESSPLALIQKYVQLLRVKDLPDLAISTTSKLLETCIETNIKEHSSEVVSALIISLSIVEKGGKVDSSTLTKYGSRWRSGLIYGSKCNDNDYTMMLDTICDRMLEDPANSTIFALFATMLGQGIELSKASKAQTQQITKRIKTCTKMILRRCLNELLKSSKKDEMNEINIFVKLCPLLMLRRVPIAYYELLQIDSDCQMMLSTLSDQIAFRLGLENNERVPLAKIAQERQLLIELAPRCFCFSQPSDVGVTSTTCYVRYCEPIFSTILQKLDDNLMVNNDWKKAKLSLFICCNIIQLKPYSMKEDDFGAIIYFIIHVLRVHKNIDTNLKELQIGCIDFLASCIELSCTNIKASPMTLTRDFVKEIEGTKAPNYPHPRSTYLKKEVCHTLLVALLRIIGNKEKQKLGDFAHFQFIHEFDSWPISTRTCIINALTIVSKRCHVEKIESLTNLAVPYTLFVIKGEIDDNIRHPLCIAAVLQFLFTLVARSNSIQYLFSHQNEAKVMFSLSIEAMKYERGDTIEAHTISTMRVSALKLLLVMIATDQSSTYDRRFFSPEELSRALSVVKGAGNVDTDNEVRKLASQLSSLL